MIAIKPYQHGGMRARLRRFWAGNAGDFPVVNVHQGLCTNPTAHAEARVALVFDHSLAGAVGDGADWPDEPLSGAACGASGCDCVAGGGACMFTVVSDADPP